MNFIRSLAVAMAVLPLLAGTASARTLPFEAGSCGFVGGLRGVMATYGYSVRSTTMDGNYAVVEYSDGAQWATVVISGRAPLACVLSLGVRA